MAVLAHFLVTRVFLELFFICRALAMHTPYLLPVVVRIAGFRTSAAQLEVRRTACQGAARSGGLWAPVPAMADEDAAAPVGQPRRASPERRGRAAAHTGCARRRVHHAVVHPQPYPMLTPALPARRAQEAVARGGKGVAVVSWALAIALAVLLAYPAACAAAYAAGAAAAVFRALLWRPHWLASAACAAALGARLCDLWAGRACAQRGAMRREAHCRDTCTAMLRAAGAPGARLHASA